MERAAQITLDVVREKATYELGILWPGDRLHLTEASERHPRQAIIDRVRAAGGKVFERRVFVTEQWKEVQ